MGWTKTGVVSTAALLLLAACSDAGSGSDGQTNAGKPADIKGTLSFWDTSDATNEAPAFKELVGRFEATYPGVTVNYQSVPFDQAQNKFKTAAEAGSGAPDILRAEVAWVPEFASLGYLYALDGTDLVADADDYLETPMSSNKYDGKTYGVPQVTDSLALLYNKTLLDKAGVSEPPATWDEVKTAGEKLRTEAGAEGIYVSAGGYFLLPFIYGEGGDLVDVDSKQILVSSEASASGVATAVDLIKSGAAVKPPASDSYTDMMTLFSEGKVGMIINGPWEVNNIRNAKGFGGIDNLGIAPVPAGSEQAGSPVGGHNYVVYSGMPEEKAEAATAFIGFMNSTESQAFLADKLGLLPTRASAYEVDSVRSNPIISAFKPVVDASVARPWIPEGGQFFTALDAMAVETLVQGADPQKSLDKVANAYKTDVLPAYSLE